MPFSAAATSTRPREGAYTALHSLGCTSERDEIGNAHVASHALKDFARKRSEGAVHDDRWRFVRHCCLSEPFGSPHIGVLSTEKGNRQNYTAPVDLQHSGSVYDVTAATGCSNEDDMRAKDPRLCRFRASRRRAQHRAHFSVRALSRTSPVTTRSERRPVQFRRITRE